MFLYDDEGKAGVWMIDFAKTLPHPESSLSHRATWQLGNFEDGYLTGLDNLIQVGCCARSLAFIQCVLSQCSRELNISYVCLQMFEDIVESIHS